MSSTKLLYLSVIICTFNRPEKLNNLLQALSRQEVDSGLKAEVIVMDCSASYKVSYILSRYDETSFKFKLRYIPLTKNSLSRARNLGLDQSEGNLICFIDDDCIPQNNWLLTLKNIYTENEFDAIAGPVIPKDSHNMPSFFVRYINIFWGVLGFYRLDAGPMCYMQNCSQLPMGANMAISRNCYDSIGKFREDLGVGSGAVGEDTDYFQRILKSNKVLMYDPSLSIMHDTDKNRTTLMFIVRWYLLKVNYLLRCSKSDNEIKLLTLLKIIARSLAKVFEILSSKKFVLLKDKGPTVK